MGQDQTATLYRDQLCERVASLRIAKGWTQEEMARALKIKFESYKKYETRSAIPHHLIPSFAQLVDRSVAYVLTGRDETARRGPKALPSKDLTA